jgi:hypothetical protein
MCEKSWASLKTFLPINHLDGILTFRATNHYFKNKISSTSLDITIEVKNPKDGGDYNLIIEKETEDDIIISLPGNSTVSGSSDSFITLTGAYNQQFWLQFTYHGLDFMWALLGVSNGVGDGGDSGTPDAELLGAAAAYSDLGDAATVAYYDTQSLTISEIVPTTYTFVLADRDKMKIMDSEALEHFIVPLYATVPYPVGTKIHTSTKGIAGITAFSAMPGVTINSADGFLRLRTRHACAMFLNTGIDEWLLTGDISL